MVIEVAVIDRSRTRTLDITTDTLYLEIHCDAYEYARDAALQNARQLIYDWLERNGKITT